MILRASFELSIDSSYIGVIDSLHLSINVVDIEILYRCSDYERIQEGSIPLSYESVIEFLYFWRRKFSCF